MYKISVENYICASFKDYRSSLFVDEYSNCITFTAMELV